MSPPRGSLCSVGFISINISSLRDSWKDIIHPVNPDSEKKRGSSVKPSPFKNQNHLALDPLNISTERIQSFVYVFVASIYLLNVFYSTRSLSGESSY